MIDVSQFTPKQKAAFRDIAGEVAGKLIALHPVERGRNGGIKWLWKCECGNETVLITSNARSSGHCGCESVDKGRRNRKHGMYRTPEYNSYHSMKQRCLYKGAKRYAIYGGRGIKVCERWLASFENFLQDMGRRPDGHTLDRIDVNGDYKPENCRWATVKQQARNTRSNTLVAIGSEVRTIAEWCEISGISQHAAHSRMKKGWGVKESLTEPISRKVKGRNNGREANK